MRTDSEIKRDVESELKWDPELDATDIAVSVKGGVVALSGYTRSYADKYVAERVAKRVAGVHGVADDIEVRRAELRQGRRSGNRARRGRRDPGPATTSLTRFR